MYAKIYTLSILMFFSVLVNAENVNFQLIADNGVAGEWTKCIASSNGKRYNIVNGKSSAKQCHKLAIKCTGDSNVSSTYHSNPVIINAPYERCTAIL